MTLATPERVSVRVNAAGALVAIPRGFPILFGGNRVAVVPDAIADAFTAGDRLIVDPATGEVLHFPGTIADRVATVVDAARDAFAALAAIPDSAIDAFYDAFAARLADDATWAHIQAANDADVARARERGRSTTRLIATPTMRARKIGRAHV